MTPAVVILGLVTLQRLGELVLAEANTRALLAQGAKEEGRAHYPLIVAVHAAWLIGLWLLAHDLPADPFWLGLFLLLQLGRVWVIATLGRRWTTRIIVLPGAPLIRTGPYRFVAHPNYVVVAGEILALPMAFGLWGYALVFTLLDALVLWLRIGTENRALEALSPP